MYVGGINGWVDQPFFLVHIEAPGFHILRFLEVVFTELVERPHVLEETPFGLAFEIQVEESGRLGGFCQFSNLYSVSAYHSFVADSLERCESDGLAVNRGRRQFGCMRHCDESSWVSFAWLGKDVEYEGEDWIAREREQISWPKTNASDSNMPSWTNSSGPQNKRSINPN